MDRNRHRARRLTFAASLVISAAALIPVAAVAAPTSKSQDPNVSPASVFKGTTVAFAVSITNTSGSGNITAQGIRVKIPVGLDTGDILSVVNPGAGTLTSIGTTLAAPSPYIEILSANVLRNATYNFTINARIPCNETATSYSWATDVRQSNDYSGTGNELPAKDVPVTTVAAGGCSLVFTTQPTNAVPNSTITGTAFDQTGPAVTVQARNGAGSPLSGFSGTITLTSTPGSTLSGGGPLSASNATSSASFSSLKIVQSGTYTLTASTTVPGVSSSPPSGSFKVGYGTTNSCTALDNQACSTGTIPGPTTGTSGAITVNDSDGLTADLSAEFFDGSINCSSTGYVEFGDNLFFDVTNVTAGATTGLTKTVTLTKPIPTDPPRPSGTGEEWRYQLCFQSKVTFKAVPTFGSAQANFDSLLQALSNGDFTNDAEVVSTPSEFVLASAADLADPNYVEYRGLLPRCSLVANIAPCLDDPIDPASTSTPKARIPPVKFNGDGTVTFTALVPIGDPMGR